MSPAPDDDLTADTSPLNITPRPRHSDKPCLFSVKKVKGDLDLGQDGVSGGQQEKRQGVVHHHEVKVGNPEP